MKASDSRDHAQRNVARHPADAVHGRLPVGVVQPVGRDGRADRDPLAQRRHADKGRKAYEAGGDFLPVLGQTLSARIFKLAVQVRGVRDRAVGDAGQGLG